MFVPSYFLEYAFESSHKIPEKTEEIEFQTSHKIPKGGVHQRDELHQSMRSKEKPELDDQLGGVIADDIRNNIEAKRLSEYEYVVEPLTTTAKPLTSVGQSINEGLVDDFSILEEAGSENKQSSRIKIKKGPNGQDYEYEYVYYYYDDEEAAKNNEDDDVIVANKKTAATPASAGKSRYANVERSSTAAPIAERNEIPTRGKARAQSLPAPVVEEIVSFHLKHIQFKTSLLNNNFLFFLNRLKNDFH